MKVDKEISEDEAALYDRQIRLWGVDAQKKLLASRVLLVNMQGLGAEIAKNLVLSGVNTLTLLDSNEVQEDDLMYNFLINRTSLKTNRAESCIEALQTLNPLVKINSDKDSVRNKEESYFENFDIVCALSVDLSELELIDTYCRRNNVMFLCGFVYGLYGFAFVDFGDFKYLIEAPKISNENETDKKSCAVPDAKQNEKLELQQKNINYKSFSEFMGYLKKPTQNLSTLKLKRLSKAYFMFLVFNAFFQSKKRPFSPHSKEDHDELVKIKRVLFEQSSFDQEILPDSFFNDKSFSEFTPVNAIMGGVLAQEVVKAISKKNEPINNFFVFDGNSMSGEVILI